MVKTGIQVPIHLMYLDGGQVPARYTVKRCKFDLFQYILHHHESSLIYRMLEFQQNQPVRGDLFSECKEIIEDFRINMNIEDIKLMSRKQF